MHVHNNSSANTMLKHDTLVGTFAFSSGSKKYSKYKQLNPHKVKM